MNGMTVVYSGQNGFVTDVGESVTLTAGAGDMSCDIVLGRFGVWKYDESKRKHQVVLVTEDIATARQEADK